MLMGGYVLRLGRWFHDRVVVPFTKRPVRVVQRPGQGYWTNDDGFRVGRPGS